MEYFQGIEEGHRDSLQRMGYQIMNIIGDLFNFKIHWIRESGKMKVRNIFDLKSTFTFRHFLQNGCVDLISSSKANFSATAIKFTSEVLHMADNGLSVFRHR